MLGGRAADLLGRRRLFVVGVALFSAASLFNGLAQSSTMLIIGRGVQGLGGALVSPAALSIIMTTFQDTGERTKALGVWSAIAAGGAAFGLLLGGVLTDLVSWRGSSSSTSRSAIATVLLALRYVPESRADLGHRTLRRRRRDDGHRRTAGRSSSRSSRRRPGAGAPTRRSALLVGAPCSCWRASS